MEELGLEGGFLKGKGVDDVMSLDDDDDDDGILMLDGFEDMDDVNFGF